MESPIDYDDMPTPQRRRGASPSGDATRRRSLPWHEAKPRECRTRSLTTTSSSNAATQVRDDDDDDDDEPSG